MERLREWQDFMLSIVVAFICITIIIWALMLPEVQKQPPVEVSGIGPLESQTIETGNHVGRLEIHVHGRPLMSKDRDWIETAAAARGYIVDWGD